MSTKSKSVLILLGVLTIGIAIGVLASGTLRQQRESRFSRMPPDQRLFSFMDRIIQPTPEQRQTFDRILETRSEQLREVHETHQNQVIALYDSLRSDLQSILTEEQRIRFEDQIVRGSHRIAESRIAHLTEALKLDKAQQERIKAIMADFRRMPPRPNGRRARRSWDDRRQAFSQGLQKMDSEIEAVLTPEQIEKFRAMRMSRRPSFGRPPPPFQGPRRR